jgi:hypothetical protein
LSAPTSQYVRLFSGLRRSTSREYLVLLADDQRGTSARPSMATVIPGQPAAFQARTAAGENAPGQDMPLDWVRGVERLHRLPAHAGVPQHRWGVFLNDFDPVHTWPRRLG